MTNKKELGNWGEEIALNYLLHNNYQLITRSWRHGHSEIDLIMLAKNITALEIKTRSKDVDYVLTEKQLGRIRLALYSFCQQYNYDYDLTTVDLIVIIKNKYSLIIKHFKNI